MKLSRLFLSMTMALLIALPAAAQQRRSEGEHEHERSDNRAQPRQEAPRNQGNQQQTRQREGQARQRQDAPPQRMREEAQRRQPERAQSDRSVYTRRNDDGRYQGRAYERPHVAPYRRYYYPRPYYSFRPRFALGFGLWIGYPVPYPYYGYPYAADGYAYPGADYPPPPPPDSVGVEEGQPYGGVSFEIGPSDASVYVDGGYAGVVSDFTPNAQPLSLDVGRHHIEVDAPGYRPMAFDVNVIAGQVIPYRGQMVPY